MNENSGFHLNLSAWALTHQQMVLYLMI